MNNVILVGRLTATAELKKSEEDKMYANATLAINRPYKSAEGKIDTDFIRIVVWNNIAESLCKYCQKGDVIGIKGRLQTNSYEDENKVKHYSTDVIGEKLTFLSSSKSKNDPDSKDEGNE